MTMPTRIPGTPLDAGDLTALLGAQQDQIDDLATVIESQQTQITELRALVEQLLAVNG
jgi:hypothetical protein